MADMLNPGERSDVEWAKILEVDENKIPKIKKIIRDNYRVHIIKTNPSGREAYCDGKYHGYIERRHDTPSGMERWIPQITINQGYDTIEEAVTTTNKFLLSLEFSPFAAAINEVPIKSLQLLYGTLRTNDHQNS